jgi:FkbM family methyltransferase
MRSAQEGASGAAVRQLDKGRADSAIRRIASAGAAMRAWINSLVKRTKTVKKLNEQLQDMREVLQRLVMKDGMIELPDGARFFLPDCIEDSVQRRILLSNNYYEYDLLGDLETRLPNEGVFFDVGANIGNHTIFWARRGARTVHAFEPVRSTFELLEKNVSLNNLSANVVSHNFGLGEAVGSARVVKFTHENIAATQLGEHADGDLAIGVLDEFARAAGRVDFIKIDTEGFELKVLRGAREAIAAHRPIILVEVWPRNQNDVFSWMRSNGYALAKTYPVDNFLFEPAR